MAKKLLLVTLLSSSALALHFWGAPAVFGHNTGREARTVKQCERLPTPEREACIKCITRPAKYHYHPDYPAGNRCRIDNGKP
jgi:hypothetical protein